VLGVARDADPATIRAAYRERARQHHPDRRTGRGDGGGGGGGGTTEAELEMAAINEAYRVLSDRGRRAVYDRSLTAGRVTSDAPVGTGVRVPGASSGEPPPWTVPSTPARMPWKLMGGMAVLGIAGVLVGAALRDPPKERPPDGLLRPGSCVEVDPSGEASEVNCRGEGDLVVAAVVAFDAACPPGTEPHRDRQGLGLACVVAPRAP
jgi:molecular chaperone DnaJ